VGVEPRRKKRGGGGGERERGHPAETKTVAGKERQPASRQETTGKGWGRED
jgi:hypothetical protein